MRDRLKMTENIINDWNQRKHTAEQCMVELWDVWSDRIIRKNNPKIMCKRHLFTEKETGNRLLKCIYCGKKRELKKYEHERCGGAL